MPVHGELLLQAVAHGLGYLLTAPSRSRGRYQKAPVCLLRQNWASSRHGNRCTLGMCFRLKVILASLANLLVVSYIHYITGYQFLFFVFYFIPVALCGWYLGRLSVVCMAILTGVSWCFVDILSNHYYTSEIFRYANSFICFIAFATIGVLFQGLRQSLNEQTKARQELENTLNELNRSTGQIRKLQSQLQVVCAWTKRINVEGKWVALDEFLTDKLNAKISYGVSPEAMQEVLNLEKAQDPVSA
jgi:K+-sensing histidine kinase KdpD